MDQVSEEWITVSEYALRRRISERQARRIVAFMPDNQRTAPDVRPAKVLWNPVLTEHLSGQMSGTSPAESPEGAEYHAERAPIGTDQPRPGADRWQDGPAESPAGPPDVRQDVRQTPEAQDQALAKMLEVLQEQLAKKDEQLAEKDRLICDQARQIERLLNAALDTAANEQQLRMVELTRTLQKQIAPPRRSWWQNAIAAWRDPRIEQ